MGRLGCLDFQPASQPASLPGRIAMNKVFLWTCNTLSCIIHALVLVDSAVLPPLYFILLLQLFKYKRVFVTTKNNLNVWTWFNSCFCLFWWFPLYVVCLVPSSRLIRPPNTMADGRADGHIQLQLQIQLGCKLGLRWFFICAIQIRLEDTHFSRTMKLRLSSPEFCILESDQ